MKSISVVVCTYNDAAHLEECIKSLLCQDYPESDYEIIVVDDGSTDQTRELVIRNDQVRYIHQENAGPSAARNTGIAAARGDLVAFTDSDCEVETNWLTQCALMFENGPSDLGGIGGTQAGHSGDNGFARKVDAFLRSIAFVADYTKHESDAKEVAQNASCNSCYPREVLEQVGGFREGLFPGEDVDVDRRIKNAGYRLMYSPAMMVHHHRPDSWRRWIRMVRAYGAGQGVNVRIHGVFRLIHLVPPLLTAMLFAGAASVVLPDLRWAWQTSVLAFLLVGLFLSRRGRLPYLDTLRFAASIGLLYTLCYWRGVLAPGVPLSKSLSPLPE